MDNNGAGQDVSRRARRRLLTTLTMSTALCLGAVPVVLSVTHAAAQADGRHSFNIPSQPLNAALRSFANRTGVQIAYQTSVAAGAVAPAVSGTMSAEDGLARLLSGSGLHYSFTGANTVTILDPASTAGADGPITDGSTVLEAITVTAAGSAQTVAGAPATVTLIDGETINSRSYSSVNDVLRDVPGIVLSAPSTKTGDAGISMRGLGQAYVLMMVDGRPLGNSSEATYNGWGSGLDGGYLPPPAAIERIEVVRGPMSSLYGTAALGGVINVITKPVADAWTGSVTGGMTIYDDKRFGKSYEGRFHVSGPIIADVVGLSLYGSIHERLDHILVDGNLNSIGRDSLGGRLTWNVNDSNRLALEIARNATDIETVGPGRNAGDVLARRMNYSLTHNLDWGNDYETVSYLNYEDLDFNNGDYGSGYTQLNLNSKTSLSLGSHDITAGLDYRSEETQHEPDRFPGSDPVMTRWNFAVFGEDNWRVFDSFTATLGARYDYNERYGSHFTPRLYGVWEVSPDLTLKGGVSGGYKVPQLKQADGGIFEPAARGAAWDQGNTNLKPEESTNFEVGAVWASPLGFQLGLTAYHTRFSNKIDRQEICFDPVGLTCRGRSSIRQYVNRDAAELNGVEVTLDFPVGDVDVSLNYTYADSEITKGAGAGERFNDLPEHVANLGLNWRATDALNVWGRAQYRSATHDAGTGHIPEHVLFDLGGQYDFNEHLQANFAVYNVADKTFDNDYLDGRRFYLGMTSRF
ncbi:TonB-dependent receptor [Nitratireductor pacificus]|uniref:TonB-dependent receptor, plug n=1 Tax=Nitratireductor pacificus pht-3B TaxID=391937 RepID=K2MBT0_9HYPH|nr:TonB-dependent receptor [Nitratireductor pacificus]EKF18330.1 TonB-dependent receptor, plug [Nitratireductor pacificus pht-3B]